MSKVNLFELRDVRRDARDRLGKAYAADLIDDEELERRLEAVENAPDPDAVREIYEDVVPPGEAALVPTAPPPSTALAVADDAPGYGQEVAIFGEIKRAGPAWTPARANLVRTIFGSAELDFREAQLAAGTTEIDLQLVFGEVQILVPPGLPVESQCTVVFGEVEIGNAVESGRPDPNGPRLVLTGYVVFGSVSVHERLPGESRREAKRRLKAERKRLKEEQRRQLKEDKRRRKALKSG